MERWSAFRGAVNPYRFDRVTPRVRYVAFVLASLPGVAYAGGFEIPDNGTQALGRGTAFVAKADDGTALQYNPAGFARQRGTRVLANGNVYFQSYSYRRIGTFPDDPNDPATPWGGKPYPEVENSAGPYTVPFIALSTDFGALDRFTLAAGVYGPSIIGNRTFPLGVRGAPASSRYDFIQSRDSFLFPSLAAAYRITPWLDLGVTGHLVLAKIDQTIVTYADTGQCKNQEYQPCDSRGTLTANGTTAAATVGLMLRPDPSWAVGLSVRTPVSVEAKGQLKTEAPRVGDLRGGTGDASVSTKLPLVARLGARYIQMDREFEVWDLELDGVYEGWGGAQGDGVRVVVPRVGDYQNIDALVRHGYKSTFSIRGGGAHNFEAGGGLLTVRLGGFYETPATDFATTRLDYDTLSKIAGTIGVGYKIAQFGFDVGYAGVASVPRTVGVDQGDVRPINIGKNGNTVDANDQRLGAVNEGAYRGFTHVLSVGITITFDTFFGEPRKVHYGNPYEPGYEPEGAPPSTKKKEKESEKGDGWGGGLEEKKPAPKKKPKPEPEPTDD